MTLTGMTPAGITLAAMSRLIDVAAHLKIQDVRPVHLLLAAFSRHDQALDWAAQRAGQAWGPMALVSPPFVFDDTEYYRATMGPDLKKVFFLFQQPVDAAELPARKHQSNAWEEDYRLSATHAEPRPLNLDPGYLTEAKLVLATTKDRDHRLYLGRGIFGEVTLHYHHGAWRHRPWTYPDYQRPDYQQFFLQCREYIRRAGAQAAS